MNEIELLDRADEQEVILRCAYAIQHASESGLIGMDPGYLKALARRARIVGYEQMKRLLDARETAA
jgi:hypothetical protein